MPIGIRLSSIQTDRLAEGLLGFSQASLPHQYRPIDQLLFGLRGMILQRTDNVGDQMIIISPQLALARAGETQSSQNESANSDHDDAPLQKLAEFDERCHQQHRPND